MVATLFAVTGPSGILLNVAIDAGLSAALIDSWILISHVVGGGLSVLFSVVYRQPLTLAWTIPGVCGCRVLGAVRRDAGVACGRVAARPTSECQAWWPLNA